MLDSIINLVKDQALEAITNNSNVPEDKKDAAVATTTSTIIDSLKNEINPDNISSIIGLLGNNSSLDNNPLAGSIQNSLVSALSSKVGLDQGIANNIASTVIPALLNAFTHKSNDPDDSFNIESMVQSFIGKDSNGILSKIGKLFGM